MESIAKKRILLLSRTATSLNHEYEVLKKQKADVFYTPNIQHALNAHQEHQPFDILIVEHSDKTKSQVDEFIFQLNEIQPLPTIIACPSDELDRQVECSCNSKYGSVLIGGQPFSLIQTIQMSLRLFDVNTERKKHREVLEEREELLTNVFESMEEAILVLDTDYRYTYWNSAMERMTAKKRKEVLGDTVWEHFPGLKSELVEGKKRAMAGERVSNIELDFVFPDGKEGWASHSFLPLRNWHKEVVGIVGVLVDISDRKHYEKEIIESEIRYRELVEASTNAVVVHDGDEVLFVNKAALFMFGAESIEDLLGQKVMNFIPLKARPQVESRWKEAFSKGHVPKAEINLLRRDGTEFTTEISGTRIIFNGNEALQIVITDITERKVAEKAIFDMLTKLQDRESLLSSINKNLRECLYRTTPEDTFIYANEAFATMFGYDSVEEIMNMHPTDFYANADDRDGYLNVINEIGVVDDDEVLLKRKDGSTFWGLVSSTVIYNDDDSVRYYDGAIHDITARKQFEVTLQRSVTEKEILLAEIHHRVKNNLAVISGLIDLQRFSMNDPAIEPILLATQNRIMSIANVHELLYRSENFAEISIPLLLEQLSEGISSSFNSKNLDIEFKISAHGIHLNANQAIPFGLMMNELINNTYKHAYNEKKSGQISIDLSELDDGYAMVYKDDGVGLDEEIDLQNMSRKSLGFSLIRNLAIQLNATFTDMSGEDGFCFEMHFPPEHAFEHELISGNRKE